MTKIINSSIKALDRLMRNYLVLLALFVFVLIIPNLLLIFTEPYSIVTAIVSITLPASLYIFCLTSSRKIGKVMLFMLPIMFFDAFQLIIMKLFNGSFIGIDMITNMITTSSAEAGELLGSIFVVLVIILVVYGTAIFFSIYSLLKGIETQFKYRQNVRQYAIYSLIGSLSIALIIQSANPYFKVTEHIFPVNAFHNTAVALVREQQKNDYFATSKDFKFDAQKSEQDSLGREIYLLVIGETSRADNFSMYGYHRNTNPQLAEIENLITATNTLAQGNVTHKIVPLLLSSVSAENFEQVYNQKSVLTAFKECGFETYFISNQPPNGSFTDFFGQEADYSVNLTINSEGGIVAPDEIMLPEIQRAIENSNKNLFIVVHTYGSHFNYSARYDENHRVFDNDDTSVAKAKNRESIVNAYDNSILYVDNLLAEIIAMVDYQQCSASVVYMSDHGEDLFDDNRGLFLHASPRPSYYQLHVPFMAWFSDKYNQRYPTKATNFESNRTKAVTSEVLFHTILDIASIETQYLNVQQSMVNHKFIEREVRYFLNDQNRAIEFYNSGITKEDFNQFEKHNIAIDKSKIKNVRY